MSTPPHPILAIDFGTQKMGLAIGQTITGTATPLNTLPAQSGKPDWSALLAIINTWSPETIVVGLPLNMDGSESELSTLARQFARRLQARVEQPVKLMDERLSSHAARSQDSDFTYKQRFPKKQRRSKPSLSIDAKAAKVIAESYLADATSALSLSRSVETF